MATTPPTKKTAVRWWILLIEILLLAALGCGASTILFSVVPVTSAAIVIVLTLVTFPMARRLSAQAHVIIAFSMYTALLLLPLAFPGSIVGRGVLWVADTIIDR